MNHNDNLSLKMIISFLSFVVSVIITKNIMHYIELPIIKESIGAPAAGVYNMMIGYPSYLLVFIPIMLFFMFVIYTIIMRYLKG